MREELRSSARRVQEALDALGYTFQVVELPDSTRTAREAAAAVGCSVGQIAKSLVFQGRESGRPLPGDCQWQQPGRRSASRGPRRTSRSRLPIPTTVRAATGFVIGGVPPAGHRSAAARPTSTRICWRSSTIWAAAGTPFAVFRLHPADLPRMTGGQVVAIAA
jgi:prolyl-tRNA editing enzyme YbaK/EbsC (Cys-tRNA(Pro) deacylase)